MNKIIPFCCDMSDKTEDEIRSLHKMCVEAGAREYDSADEWVTHADRANYMGVDEDNDLISLDHIASIVNNNIITLEGVPTHIGLLKECETSPLSDSPVKWTKAMQKEGIPLSVGMLALDHKGDVVLINCEGSTHFMVTYTTSKLEFLWTKRSVYPFPDEETIEQKAQREYFINEAKATMTTLDAEELYEDVKHLFKY